MLNRTFAAIAAATLITAPAFAQDASGDAGAGEKVFSQCQACHVVVNDAGETLAGRKAKVGPNLYGIAGAHAGSVEDFKGYSKYLEEAGAAGLVWDEASFVAYVQDPSGFLKEHTGDSKARGKMTYKVRKEADAVNVYAYLASLQ